MGHSCHFTAGKVTAEVLFRPLSAGMERPWFQLDAALQRRKDEREWTSVPGAKWQDEDRLLSKKAEHTVW